MTKTTVDLANISLKISGLVSVVIPCFNAVHTIGEAIQSVVDQDCHDIQIIVIDDGSTDGSSDYIRTSWPNVELVRTANRGVASARNEGLKLVKGSYIQYLDADDKLAPGKIKRQSNLLESTKADIAYGGWHRFKYQDGSFKLLGEMVSNCLSDVPELDLMNRFWNPPAAYLLASKALLKIGAWDESMRIVEDARYFLDAAINDCQFIQDQELACYYRVGNADSVSNCGDRTFAHACYVKAQQIEVVWKNLKRWDEPHIEEMVEAYYFVARLSFNSDKQLFNQVIQDLNRIRPGFAPKHPRLLSICSQIFGYRRAESIALVYRKVKACIKQECISQ